MRLPAGNSIPLPPTNEETIVADATDPPVRWAIEELLPFLPGWARAGSLAVRDAMLKALAEMCRLAWAQMSRRLNAQRSPRHAAGAWLTEHGELRHVPRAPGEDESAYRQRLLHPIAIITPNAIKAAVDAVVAKVTRSKAAYLEPAVDGSIFLAPVDENGDQTVAEWSCFWQGTTQRFWGYDPDRPDATWGVYLTLAPGTTGTSGNPGAPLFWIILPVNVHDDSDAGHLGVDFYLQGLTGETTENQTNIDPTASPYCYWFDAADSLMDLVIAQVEARRAFGVAWFLRLDPLLLTAH